MKDICSSWNSPAFVRMIYGWRRSYRRRDGAALQRTIFNLANQETTEAEMRTHLARIFTTAL